MITLSKKAEFKIAYDRTLVKNQVCIEKNP